jgi:hypothetical protein
MFRWGMRGARETSQESTETQVWIPVRIMGWLMLGGDLFLFGMNLVSWCLWLHRWLKNGNAILKWFPLWWERFSVRFPLLIASLIAWPVTVPIFLMGIRFVLELVDRWWPPPDSRLREQYGPMGPLWGVRAMLGLLPSQETRRKSIKQRYSDYKGQDNGMVDNPHDSSGRGSDLRNRMENRI